MTYLMVCGFVYVKVAADGVAKLDFCGLGATELRLPVGAWVRGFGLEGIVNRPVAGFEGVAVLELIVGSLCCLACCGLIRTIFLEAAKLGEIE